MPGPTLNATQLVNSGWEFLRGAFSTWDDGDSEELGRSQGCARYGDATLVAGYQSYAGNPAFATGAKGAVAAGYIAQASTEAGWDAPGAVAFGYEPRQQHAFGAVIAGDKGYNVNPYAVALAANGRGITVGAKKLYPFPRKGILSLVTTDATPDSLQNYDETGAAIAGSGVLFIDTGITRIKGSLMAYEPATGDKKLWNVDFLVHTNAAYSSTSVIGTPDYTELFEAAGATGWTFAVACDNGASTVAFEVTGEAAHTIAWSFIYDADCHEVW